MRDKEKLKEYTYYLFSKTFGPFISSLFAFRTNGLSTNFAKTITRNTSSTYKQLDIPFHTLK